MRILHEPDNSLTRQYTALMATEGVKLSFSDDAIERIADIAERANGTQDIGARRLQTVMEKLLEDVLFEGSELTERDVRIDGDYVTDHLSDIVDDEDVSKYIL